MRLLIVPAVALLAAACASGGAAADPQTGSAPAAQPGTATPAPRARPADPLPGTTPTVSTNRVVTTGGNTMAMNTMNIDMDVKLFVTGSVDEAWAVLPGVYQELGIPLTVNDNVRKTIGNTGWKMRRSIGRVPVQRYVDCGSSGTIQNAETYQLNLAIVTQVLPNQGGGSVISTTITGTGRNPVTSSSAEVRCSSKSELELRIRDMVQKAIYAK